MAIDFSKPDLGPKALEYVRASLESVDLAGDGPFTHRCHQWLQAELGTRSLLTHSCTAALEMATILSGVGPGDEVILPSYTFTSTANAVVLRGAIPVFIDIRKDTLNLDETLLEDAVSPRTRAIIPVHYGGVPCEMDTIMDFARRRKLVVIEDAAQGYLSRYKGKFLGTFGALGCLSFHVTKNIVSGEGGSLLVNDENLAERAEIVREKGTNRGRFLRNEITRYEWVDIGSSYLMSDILAALLLSQLENAREVTVRRLAIWNRYHAALAPAEQRGVLRRPIVPADTDHNGHLYYVLLHRADAAEAFRRALAEARIPSQTHYVPLHAAPAGRKFGRVASGMRVTERTAETLVRLPLHSRLSEDEVERITEAVLHAQARL